MPRYEFSAFVTVEAADEVEAMLLANLGEVAVLHGGQAVIVDVALADGIPELVL